MSNADAKKTILVIEDDQRILKALSIRLKHAGYDVVTASDGLQGLKSAVEVKPDLIISDIWMPSSVGFLVAERMKTFGLGAIPVIFITGNKKKNLSRLAQEIGAVAFFEKPFDSEELLDAVAQALNSVQKGTRTALSATGPPKRLERSGHGSPRSIIDNSK